MSSEARCPGSSAWVVRCAPATATRYGTRSRRRSGMSPMIAAVGLYRPAWADSRGRCVLGLDEDVVTLAVAGGRAVLDVAGGSQVSRVVLCTRSPDYLVG